MTLLEMVQSVQRELRLPQSGAVSEPHAKLIMGYVNKVQRSLMAEAGVWDELKIYGSFSTSAGNGIYTVSVTDGEIETIRSLSIGTSEPLEKVSDEEFRGLKRALVSQGEPQYYRYYSRGANWINIEVLPVPNAVYSINTEVLSRPHVLSNNVDVPLLDADCIVLGAIMLARKDQGEDPQTDLAVFQSKLGLLIDNSGESNWGDVEAV